MPEFLSDNVKIAYQDHGSGAPIVLIHGFASNAQVNWVDTGWRDILVAAGHRVIAFDNRGHGFSEKLYDVAAYGARTMADDAHRLLEHLEIPRADVMGYSMGARISAFLAINYPGSVRSAIFGGLGEAMITGVGGSENIARALEAASAGEVEDDGARMFRLFAEATGSDLAALAACIRSSRAKISRGMLKKVTMPVLVAVGELDRIAGAPGPLATAVPNGEVLVIPKRDHMRASGDMTFKRGVLDFLHRRP